MSEDDEKQTSQTLQHLYMINLAKDGGEILAIAQSMQIDAEAVARLRFLSHNIGGSAILFGFEDLGTASIAIEDCIRDADVENRGLSTVERHTLDAAIPHFDTLYRAALKP